MKPALDVAVAISGGVDSAMAAARLKSDGWNVCGVHFTLHGVSSMAEQKSEKVEALAEHLGVPLEIIDLRDVFEEQVVAPFIDAYLEGLTPNPCVICNPLVKFQGLHRYMLEKKFHALATGHYVRLGKRSEAGRAELLRGRDAAKDQSYFLHRLDQASLSRAVFPLGDMTKDEVRLLARAMGLPCHANPESQEICFISGTDYRGFVEEKRGLKVKKRGIIVNGVGEPLGEHEGVYRYTIGQRRGLRIASSRPYYVKELRPETNQVVVGRREELFSRRVRVRGFHWMGRLPSKYPVKMEAQIRYRHRAAPGRLEILSSDEQRFSFETPQWAVTPGQALVCYVGDRLMGGGWIVR